MKGFLLTRSWRNRGQGLEFEFWIASAQGPVQVILTGQRAVCFVERESSDDGGWVERRPVELRSLAGVPVDAVYFADRSQLESFRKRGAAVGFEADVSPVDRYLMERFITGPVELPPPARPVRGVDRRRNVALAALDPADKAPELRSMAIDIESDGWDGPLFSIAASWQGGAKVFMVDPDRRGLQDMPEHEGVSGQLEYLPDESAVIRGFCQYVVRVDPDVLLGWNVIDFDLEFLAKRSRKLGVALALGRGGTRAEVFARRSRVTGWMSRYRAAIPGRVVLDGITALRSSGYAFESYTLASVSQQILAKAKAIEADVDPLAEIRRMYAEDKLALAHYNLVDCVLVSQIFREARLIEFLVERQRLTGLALDRQGGSMAAFDHLYLPRLHRKGFVAATADAQQPFEASPGGYVMDSQPGLYRNILVLDFKSLYPSIIRTFLIDPLGLAQPGADPVPGFAGGRFSRSQHILPELIAGLWQARDAAKARASQAASSAVKVLMNSFYGVLGSPACRFYSPMLASSITRRGHEIIQRSRQWLRDAGYGVIYGDTDSLFVVAGDERDARACVELGRELAQGLNACWRRGLRTDFDVDSHLEVEFETHFLRFLMPTMRGSDKGSKKRYAGSVLRPDGATEIVFKGLEAVRSDWTPLAREFQRELYRRIFVGEPYEDYVRQTAERLRSGALDAGLVYSKALRRGVEEYTKQLPPHVQAARKLIAMGKPVSRTIRYVITVHGPQPLVRGAPPVPHIDYEHYLSRQLAPAADGILHFCDTSFEALAGQQLRLF